MPYPDIDEPRRREFDPREAHNRDGGGARFTVRLKADATGMARLTQDPTGAGRVQSPDVVRSRST
jgi:hypothetical protein